MDKALRRFREAADRENQRRGTVRRRYSKALQARAVRYWRRQKRAGEGVRDVAAALGIAPWSLRRWMQQPVTSKARFHRVHVEAARVPPTAPGLAVVITAQGPRVEGLDVEAAARLVTLLAMRWHGRHVTVYAYGAPVDLRKGFDGLCALVTHGLERDPLSGDVFLFLSRNRVRTKVLHWDGTGLCVYAKRLERGRFARLWRDAAAAPITLTVSELDLFLDGSTLVGRHALAPPALTHFSLASDRA